MPELHPWTGQPLEPWQTIVRGPAYTGPRVTVVDTRPGARLEPWIERREIPAGPGMTVTTFVDTGLPGGTYLPDAQQLPELVSVAEQPSPAFLVFLVVVIGAGLVRRFG